MILVKIHHLTANIPFRECSIRFLLKNFSSSHPTQQKTEVKLLPQTVSVDMEETIKITSGQLASKQEEDMQLCVVVLNKESVVHIGYILIDPFQPLVNRRAPLRGLPEQTGYIVYSVIHASEKKEKYPESIEKKVSIQNYIPPEPEPVEKEVPRVSEIKRSKNHIVNVTNLKINSRSTPIQRTPVSASEGEDLKFEELRSQIDSLRSQAEQYQQKMDKEVENYEKTIELLKHQLINMEYTLALKNNDIFQLRNKEKIEKLIGKTSAGAKRRE